VREVVVVLAAAAVVAIVLAGCAAPPFDPTGPCTTDGSAPGAYPDLEAQVPKVFRGTGPKLVDSGRTCTPDGLGTLTARGVKELRFAGATWGTGTDSGLTLATFTSPDGSALPPEWMAEFYDTGARAGKNVTSVNATQYDVEPGIQGRRIDVLNGESYQTVVVWSRDGAVAAVIVADFIREIQTKEAHDKVVREAVDAWQQANVVLSAPGAPVAPVSPVPSA
jgi:hypothetical protein